MAGGEATMWRVRLFDGPVLERPDGQEVARFRSAKVQALLAFLALRLGHRCPREEIADALWPDETDEKTTANRLRVTLSSLRRQLEPPGTIFGSVLDVSVPGCITLRKATVLCDVVEFDEAYRGGRLEEAAVLLRGPLLPGLYDEWVRLEQLRIELVREELSADPRPRIADFCPSVATTPLTAEPAHQLPFYLTRFMGRKEEQRSLARLMRDHRLVTLTGPGGIGKTRLAVETVSEGVVAGVFVSLAALDRPDQIPEAMLQSLRIASRSGDDPGEQLLQVLSQRPPTILILDNAEDQLDAAVQWVLRLLGEVRELKILVTSRQRLEIPGEVVVSVPPLRAPREQSSLAELLESPSAALFVDRARSAVPDFVAGERHVASIEAICRKLEGMPLAIELAAARVAVQSPAQIAVGLEVNMMELRSRQRGLSERHRSLRAAIQGSYEMLPADRQRFLSQLSTFRGGWTAEAAEKICDEGQAQEWLEDLLIRSLALGSEDETSGQIRYSFLGPLQAFAEERLSPSDREACRLRHAAYFLDLAGNVTEEDLRTLAPLDSESENLRLALNVAVRDGRYWRGLSGGLIHAFVRGRHRQALQWIEETAAEVPRIESPDHRFAWRYAACQILPDVGRFDETDAIATDMREDAEREGDVEGSIYAAVIHAFVLEMKGQVLASEAMSKEALVRARAQSNRHLLETCLSHRSGTLHVFGALAGPETARGNAALKEAESLAEEMALLVGPFSRRVPLAPLMFAAAVWPQGRLDEAYRFFKQAEVEAVRLRTMTELMYAFISEAVIVAGWGYFEQAARLYGAFQALQDRMGYSLERAQSSRPPWIERLSNELRQELGDERFAALIVSGRSMPVNELTSHRIA